MDILKNKGLRKAFICYIAAAFTIVAACSLGTIWACIAVRTWLLPESDEVFLNIETTYANGDTTTSSTRMKIGEAADVVPELHIQGDSNSIKETGEVAYSITSIENSFSSLTPKRKFLYQSCGIAMVVLPLSFSLLGILFCGMRFYKKKMKIPLELLSGATERIAKQDLDFQIVYDSEDELGALCVSFEQMREALLANHKKMWGMLEERKRLQASVAHDLRNPIAIIESHAQYLQMNLPTGKLQPEKIASIAGNMEKAAGRLERYTESIRTLNHLEELEIDRSPVDFRELYADMAVDFKRMAESCEIVFRSENYVTENALSLDVEVLYRILENLMGNALRYAETEISMAFFYEERKLTVTVMDDGPGFSGNALQFGGVYGFSDHKDKEHFGLGLALCRILCQKHGGSMTISNRKEGGARVEFSLAV